MRNFYEPFYAKCGLSNSFQDLRFTRMFYHQALYAAEKLSIHKNTLGYRLSRIMDIFDLPLEDCRTSLNLLCTALMLEIDNSLGDRKPPHEK